MLARLGGNVDNANDDRAFEAILVSAQARTAGLQGAHDSTTSGGSLGCLLMLAAGAASVGVTFMAIGAPKVPSVLILVTIVLAVSAGVGWVGWRKWSRWSEARGALQDRTDDVLIRPFVERLVPGATFSRPSVITSQYHPSLLFQKPRGASGGDRPRVEGRLAGLPAVLDEVRGNFDANIDGGWIVRLELPFAVDGHLRVRVPKSLGEHTVWREGFRPLAHETARLGTAHEIDVAPLGTGPDVDAASLPAGGLHPDALLTDALFERLRASADIDVAAAGRTLWLSLPRHIHAFDGQSGIPPDLRSWQQLAAAWHKAVQAIREIEGVVTAVVAPLAKER
jgi:hypothetical protein